MLPASPPLPTPMYLRFHFSGSQTSNPNSGRTVATTRHSAGTGRAATPGGANMPAATGVAERIAIPGNERRFSSSHRCDCARAGKAAKASTAQTRRLNMRLDFRTRAAGLSMWCRLQPNEPKWLPPDTRWRKLPMI